MFGDFKARISRDPVYGQYTECTVGRFDPHTKRNNVV